MHAFAIKVGLIFALLCTAPASAGEEDAVRLQRKRSEILERMGRKLNVRFFTGVVFRKCSEIKDLSLKNCEAKKYLIRYTFGKFVYLDDPTRSGSWPWDAFKIVPQELSIIKADKKLQLSEADYFYTYEVPIVENCLLNECRDIFERNHENRQQILWDGISPVVYWRGLTKLFLCLTKTYYGDPKVMREQKRLAFENANIGIYGECFSDETPKRIIEDSLAHYREIGFIGSARF